MTKYRTYTSLNAKTFIKKRPNSKIHHGKKVRESFQFHDRFSPITRLLTTTDAIDRSNIHSCTIADLKLSRLLLCILTLPPTSHLPLFISCSRYHFFLFHIHSKSLIYIACPDPSSQKFHVWYLKVIPEQITENLDCSASQTTFSVRVRIFYTHPYFFKIPSFYILCLW
ncbi:hypothetical protein PUMCH_000933 [Australozyma saopauloensis]|uniref:Uncharacterized protein n=1 Tax=Australozyma saopauloensis TaxID=291208 RepID=A0AAX4H642_9ASCO|nr:hypothetical protein PUMCH_000933 [[Candida] saopauloensis]